MPHKSRFIIIFLVLALCAFVFVAATNKASAHATPIKYEPDASSLLQTAPQFIKIYFSERIEPSASNIQIFGPDGSDAAAGAPSLDPGQTIYGTDLKNGGEGTYTVSWQVVSADDGHFTKGAFLFSVGKETLARGNLSSQIQVQHLTSIPEAITIWLELVGQAILLAALILVVFLRKQYKKLSFVLPEDFIEKRFARLVGVGTSLAFSGAVSFLVLKTFDLEQLHGTSFWPTFWTFIQTAGGTFALYRLIFTIIFITTFLFVRKNLLDRGLKSASFIALLTLIVLMLWARTRVSHAAAAHFYPGFAILVHTIHLFFKEFWAGALFVFILLFVPLFSKTKNSRIAAFSLACLSKILSVALCVIGVTGAYIVCLDLKSPTNIFTTEWGARFVILTMFSLLLALLRFYHQLVADRSAVAFVEGNAGTKDKKIISWLPYSLGLELLLGFTVLALTSYIIITTPPFVAEEYGFQKQVISQGETISLSIHAYESKEFLVTVTHAKNNSAALLSNLVVTATNEEKNIGPITATLEKRFDSGYVFPNTLLSPAGIWRVNVTAERPNAYDAVASFKFDYPKDIDAALVNSDKRSFGSFEILLIIGCLVIIGASVFLYRFSKRSVMQSVMFVAKKTTGNNGRAPASATGDLQFSSRGALGPLAAFAGLGLMIFLVWFIDHHHIATDFEKQCLRDNNFWIQSVPLRNGATLSADTVTGCTLSVGLNHFADQREYNYFMRPAEAAADLKLTPAQPIAGKPAQFTISLNNLQNGRKTGPAQELTVEHERIMHVLIVGADLQTFAHIHSEDLGSITEDMIKNATFPLQYTFPKAGHYTIVVNYYIRAKQFIQQFFIDVSGSPQMATPQMDVPREDFSQDKTFDGYHVVFGAPSRITANAPTKLTYHIEKDGKPVTDMEPYLAAAMHLGIVGENLQGFIHGHGAPALPGSAALQQLFSGYVSFHSHFVPDKFGPDIQSTVVFPHGGVWQIFSEFKHNGKITVTSFMVNVGK